MEYGPSWEANSHSTGQEIYHLLSKLEVHYRVNKIMLFSRILCSKLPYTLTHSRTRLSFNFQLIHVSVWCESGFTLCGR
jgi:hypothetical protein